MRTFVKVWIGIAFLAIGFGVGVVAIAAVVGHNDKNLATHSITETYEGVTSIDLDIAYGDVEIIKGDTFSINAENLVGDEFESYISGDTWYVSQQTDKSVGIFGIDISLGQLGGWDDDYVPRITITVPKDFTADQFTLNMGAGEVSAESIQAFEGQFEIGAGRLEVNQITVSNKAYFNVGAGEMVLSDAMLNDITMECGVGSVSIEGTITGNNDISSGVGSIDLDLNGSKEDYSYEISAGIGDVDIGNQSFTATDKSIDNPGNNFMRLESGVGEISVDFTE